MRKVTYEFSAGEYTILKLDGPIPQKQHTTYIIDGKKYDIVPVYDMPNCIAVRATGNFIGKEVQFALSTASGN